MGYVSWHTSKHAGWMASLDSQPLRELAAHDWMPHFAWLILTDRLRNISKKRKFVADGVFYAELNEVCGREH